MRTIAKGIACLTTALFVSASAQAAISVQSLGSAAPPATLGGNPMTPAVDNPAATFGTVTSVDLGPGSTLPLGFSVGVSHRSIGSGWGSWSHGYFGDVYFADIGAGTLTMSLPAGIAAFYFYAEPNDFGSHEITATGTDSTGATATLSQQVLGLSGAQGWGFVASGASITSITVSNPSGSALGFAVGEFGYAIPGPASLALLGAAGLVGRRRRRS